MDAETPRPADRGTGTPEHDVNSTGPSSAPAVKSATSEFQAAFKAVYSAGQDQLQHKSAQEILDATPNFTLGNNRKVAFDNPEMMAAHAELAKSKLIPLLKHNVEHRAEVVKQGAEYWAKNGFTIKGLNKVLAMAGHDAEYAADLTYRLKLYQDAHVLVSNELHDVLTKIRLQPQDQLLELQYYELVNSLSALETVVGNVVTAGARTTSFGNILKRYSDTMRLDPNQAGLKIRDLVAQKAVNPKTMGELKPLLEALQGEPAKIGKVISILNSKPGGWLMNLATEWRINAMLSGPKTQAVNLIGNAVKAVTMPMETILGGALRGDASMVRRGADLFAGMTQAWSESWKMMRYAWRAGENMLDKGGRVADGTSYTQSWNYDYIKAKHVESLFQKNQGNPNFRLDLDTHKMPPHLEAFARFIGFAGTYVNIPGRMLMAGDEFFKTLNYRADVTAQLRAEARAAGVRDVDQHVVDNMAAHFDDATKAGTNEKALQYARESTWTQDLESGVAKWLTQGANQYPFIRFLVPFIRTPTNLIVDAFHHTPALNLLSKQYRDRLFKGTPEDQARALGEMCSGMAVVGSAVALAYAGRITGTAPRTQAERTAWQANGIEPFSVKIGGTWVPYGRVDPWSTILGATADIVNWGLDETDTDQSLFSAVGAAAANNFRDKTYLRGISEFFAAVFDDDDWSGKKDRFAQSAALSFWPNLFNQTNQMAVDPHAREARGLVDSFLNRVPLASDNLPVKYNWITGKPVDRVIFHSVDRSDPGIAEMGRLGEFLERLAPAKSIQGVELSGWQYSRLCQLYGTVKIDGETFQEALGFLIEEPEYLEAADEIKAKMIRELIHPYREEAESVLFEESPRLERTVEAKNMMNKTKSRKDSEGFAQWEQRFNDLQREGDPD